MTTAQSIKRPTCDRCGRPLRNCICALACPTANQIEVLILQHPNEATNSKNTAGLLHLSLNSSRIEIGESFAEEDLRKWLFDDQKQPLLLYPEIPDYKALGLAAPQPPLASGQFTPNQVRLVTIDATWRKSRKMLYLNSMLQSLPRISLTDPPASIYKIRKARGQNQLSTLEASCYALQQLEQQQAGYAPLLAAMALFVAQQSNFVPTVNGSKLCP